MEKDRTKEAFASELGLMLDEMPLEKVRVNELCARCGANRQLFYYHFRDKYDLVAWVFKRDILSGYREAGRTGYIERTARALEHMWEHRHFYRVAFSDKSQNSIGSYIQDFDVAMSSAAIKRHFGQKDLSPQQLFDIKHQSYGSINCNIEWLKGELKMTPEQFAAWEFKRMPKYLQQAYDDTDIEFAESV